MFSFILNDDYEIVEGDLLYKINGGACTGSGSGGRVPTLAGEGEQGGRNTSTQENEGELNTSLDIETPIVTNSEDKGGDAGYVIDKEGAGGMGHAGMYVQNDEGEYSFFEVHGIENVEVEGKENKEKTYEELILSKDKNLFPPKIITDILKISDTSGVIQRNFTTKQEMLDYLKTAGTKGGYDIIIEFNTTKEQDRVIYTNAVIKGQTFKDYSLIGNSCGIWAQEVLTTETEIASSNLIKPINPFSKVTMLHDLLINTVNYNSPNMIGYGLSLSNPDSTVYGIKK